MRKETILNPTRFCLLRPQLLEISQVTLSSLGFGPAFCLMSSIRHKPRRRCILTHRSPSADPPASTGVEWQRLKQISTSFHPSTSSGLSLFVSPRGLSRTLMGSTMRKILCIDDHRATVTYFAQVFRGAGYCCIAAENFDQAEHAFSTENIDLVVVDHGLPGVNGAELAAHLKKIRPVLPSLCSPAAPTCTPSPLQSIFFFPNRSLPKNYSKPSPLYSKSLTERFHPRPCQVPAHLLHLTNCSFPSQ